MRPSYKDAIQWMVENDDTDWVEADPQSVTAALVADMFGKTDDRVRLDLAKALKKAARRPSDWSVSNAVLDAG